MMEGIKRNGICEENAYAKMVEAGSLVFLNFCVGNVGGSVKEQVNGALDDMEENLRSIGLTLENVVKVTVLLRDAWNIPVMEEVFRQRFRGKYPARTTIQTNFAHAGGPGGLEVQIDAIAYRGTRA